MTFNTYPELGLICKAGPFLEVSISLPLIPPISGDPLSLGWNPHPGGPSSVPPDPHYPNTAQDFLWYK